MATFNENLGNFLTECRNNALEELRYNTRYSEWKRKQKDVRSRLESIISAEAVRLLEEYSETVHAVQGMEFNKIHLCGLTILSDIRRRFDAASPEYPSFEEEYL